MHISYYIDQIVPEMGYNGQNAYLPEHVMITKEQSQAAAYVALRADHYASVDLTAYQTAKAAADHALAIFKADPTEMHREAALAALDTAKVARAVAAKSAGVASRLAMRAHEIRTAYDAQL